MLKEVAKSEAQPGLKFKVVESGGRTVKSSVQQSNPTTISGCQSGDCVACKGVGGQEDPAGNPMVCISIPASAAQKTDHKSILERQQGICTQGAETKVGTLKRKKQSPS